MRANSLEVSPRIHHREQVMGTVVTFDIYCDDHVAQHKAHVHIARARAILHHADALFSTWKEHSPINRLRRGDITLDEAPGEVKAVLGTCAEARAKSGGWFDPWAMPGGVDPTGYVKGWAAQRARDALARAGIRGAIVNAAGDIATYRCPEASNLFRIGIVDPQAPHRLACVVELDGAIATSAAYERGEHLIDPHSGQPCSRVASASVTGPDLGLADALATALAVAGEEGLAMIETHKDYHGLVIGWDGSWSSTANFPFAPDLSPAPNAGEGCRCRAGEPEPSPLGVSD
ncbi:MAG: FAD:protein FMN transferase [Acidimicrobiales bacterium]|jgi:thiamine biosynthesis lipoprotein